jgi:hypothetical protein
VCAVNVAMHLAGERTLALVQLQHSITNHYSDQFIKANYYILGVEREVKESNQQLKRRKHQERTFKMLKMWQLIMQTNFIHG